MQRADEFLDGRKHTFIYGSRDALLHSSQYSARLVVKRLALYERAEAWNLVEDFFSAHAGKTIGGYLGYQLSVESGGQSKVSLLPDLDLRVLEECSIGRADRLADILPNVMDLPRDTESEPIELAADEEERFKASVNACMKWTRQGTHRRVTIARRVPLQNGFSLDANLMRAVRADVTGKRRHFLMQSSLGKLAGSSPEVLAEGCISRFVVNKMSGTGPIADRTATERIEREHDNSIASLKSLLATYGRVIHTQPSIAVFQDLWHLQTALTVSNDEDRRSVADVLRVTLPRAGSPQTEAECLVAKHEDFGRGPYYGLVGIVRPDGTFDFSMCIRTIFENEVGVWACVGAAITHWSTPELEWHETKLKLLDTFGRAKARLRPTDKTGLDHPRPEGTTVIRPN